MSNRGFAAVAPHPRHRRRTSSFQNSIAAPHSGHGLSKISSGLQNRLSWPGQWLIAIPNSSRPFDPRAVIPTDPGAPGERRDLASNPLPFAVQSPIRNPWLGNGSYR